MHLEQIAENILFLLFCHLKGVRNLHLGGYSVVNLCDFFNRSIENLWYNDLQQV